MATVDEQLQQAVSEHPYPLVFATISGAHLYGFSSPDSDYDLRGVHLLPLPELLGLDEPRRTVEHAPPQQPGGIELDLVTHDLEKFIRLMLRPNGYVLEQLYSPLIVQTSPAHDELKHLGVSCITRHHVHHYLGFARNQWSLFTKEESPRLKPLLYVYRVLLTGIQLMRTGRVEANLLTLNETFGLPFIGDLVMRKSSTREQMTLESGEIAEHQARYEKLVKELEQAGQMSTLPESPQPAYKGLNDLLLRCRLGKLQTQ